MTPPDRGESPRRPENVEYLAKSGLGQGRLSANAGILASWIEWLLHPEEHDYDRTIIYNDERIEKPHREYIMNPTGDVHAERPYESVIQGYYISQFLDGLAAVAIQQVERPDSLLSAGAAGLMNFHYFGDSHIDALQQNFPTEDEWSGDARIAANTFFTEFATAANLLSKIAEDFSACGPQYAAIIKGTRDNLDAAAKNTADAFQHKFDTRAGSSISFDFVGVVLGTVASVASAFMTGGAATPLVYTSATALWGALFSATTTGIKDAKVDHETRSVSGFWWKELAQSHLDVQEETLTAATAQLNTINQKLDSLLATFSHPSIQVIINKYATMS
ncbi:hypothetical protein [Actinophytocola sediminis]